MINRLGSKVLTRRSWFYESGEEDGNKSVCPVSAFTLLIVLIQLRSNTLILRALVTSAGNFAFNETR